MAAIWEALRNLTFGDTIRRAGEVVERVTLGHTHTPQNEPDAQL